MKIEGNSTIYKTDKRKSFIKLLLLFLQRKHELKGKTLWA